MYACNQMQSSCISVRYKPSISQHNNTWTHTCRLAATKAEDMIYVHDMAQYEAKRLKAIICEHLVGHCAVRSTNYHFPVKSMVRSSQMLQLQQRHTVQSRQRWLDLSVCRGNSGSLSTAWVDTCYLHQHQWLSLPYHCHDLLTTVAVAMSPRIQTSILPDMTMQWSEW